MDSFVTWPGGTAYTAFKRAALKCSRAVALALLSRRSESTAYASAPSAHLAATLLHPYPGRGAATARL